MPRTSYAAYASIIVYFLRMLARKVVSEPKTKPIFRSTPRAGGNWIDSRDIDVKTLLSGKRHGVFRREADGWEPVPKPKSVLRSSSERDMLVDEETCAAGGACAEYTADLAVSARLGAVRGTPAGKTAEN